MIPGVREKHLRAYDGTRIHYQDIGKGRVVVLANGLGGSYQAWAYIIAHLTKKYRVLSWDYRGLFQSSRPDLGRLSILDHVDDLTRILDAEGVDKALFLGWSMGTQVIYEHALRRPERTLGLVPICGGAGKPFDTALHTSTSRYTMPAVFQLMKIFHEATGRVMKAIATFPYAFEAISASGLFWRGGSELIRGLMDEYLTLDFEAYAQIMLELARHDARPYLHEITAPVLQIAATRDFFTPLKVARETDCLLADSRLEILEGATHYAPLEQPEIINAFIDEFIKAKVRWPAGKSPRKRKPKAKRASKTPIPVSES